MRNGKWNEWWRLYGDREREKKNPSFRFYYKSGEGSLYFRYKAKELARFISFLLARILLAGANRLSTHVNRHILDSRDIE